MGYYSLIQMSDLSSHEKIWRNSKYILLREWNKSEKAMYNMYLTIEHSGKGRIMETIES
jgi:hypothetical protein